MITVELIYDARCPNVQESRAQLLRAFSQVGLPARWREWERGSPESPAYARCYGSPTILINGRDAANYVPSAEANSCRLYPDHNGRLNGVPSVEVVASALAAARDAVSSDSSATTVQVNRWRNLLASFPAIGAALLPKLACPFCWPAYAGILSALGLGLVDYNFYLFPLMLIFLVIAIGTLWRQARRSRKYLSLWLGLWESIAVLIGKFALEADFVVYGGIGLLVAASLLSSWPRRAAASVPYSACAPAGSRVHTRARKETSL